MNKALARAIKIIGGQAAAAKKLGVSQPTIWYWLHQAREIPAARLAGIEKATEGKVTRKQLRPSLFKVR
jgi:DNA-binding transcriptional regulator YdaS (Cro superfamily)